VSADIKWVEVETTSRIRRCGTTNSRGSEEPVVQPAAVYTSGGQFSL